MPLTPEQKKELKELYVNNTANEIAKMFSVTLPVIANNITKLGIKKNTNSGRFKIGQEPPNKGKKLAPTTYEKIKNTMFKKGNIPPNTKPDGYESIDSKGYIKVHHNGRMRLKHRVIWESVNGKMPANCVIIFINGDNRDFRIENLECITRAENMKRNSIQRYPIEVKQVIRLKNKLIRKIKEKQNEKQN